MWIFEVIRVARAMSPELRKHVHECLKRMEEDAKKTKNPVDDVAVKCLHGVCDLVGIG